MTNDERLEILLDHLEETTSIEDALALVRKQNQDAYEADPQAFEESWKEHLSCFEAEGRLTN